MPNGDLKDYSDRELLLLTAQEVRHIKGNYEELRKEFKSTTSAFQEIVGNCRSDARRENLGRDTRNDKNFKEIFTRVNNLESWRDKLIGAWLLLTAGVLLPILKALGLK